MVMPHGQKSLQSRPFQKILESTMKRAEKGLSPENYDAGIYDISKITIYSSIKSI